MQSSDSSHNVKDSQVSVLALHSSTAETNAENRHKRLHVLSHKDQSFTLNWRVLPVYQYTAQTVYCYVTLYSLLLVHVQTVR